MSAKERRALEKMAMTIDTNAPEINQILSDAGRGVDQALIFTAAKYFEALNRLAEE